jgi:hypothetical protein
MIIRRRADLVAVTAASIIFITTVLYLIFTKSLIVNRGPALLTLVPTGITGYWAAFTNGMPFWNGPVNSLLLIGTILAIYGARYASPYRRTALVLAGLGLTWLGIFALPQLGAPTIVAGLLCLVAALRRMAKQR